MTKSQQLTLNDDVKKFLERTYRKQLSENMKEVWKREIEFGFSLQNTRTVFEI